MSAKKPEKPEGEFIHIPGYGTRYRIFENGFLQRRDARTGMWKDISTSGHPPRARLYRAGTESRRYIHKILEEVGFL